MFLRIMALSIICLLAGATALEAQHGSRGKWGSAAILYGQQPCGGNRLLVKPSVPLRGTQLIVEVFDTQGHTYTDCVIWYGTGRLNVPWFIVDTNQTCNILAWPQFTRPTVMRDGWARHVAFDIPKDPALVGTKINLQAAIRVSGQEIWSRGVETSIQ